MKSVAHSPSPTPPREGEAHSSKREKPPQGGKESQHDRLGPEVVVVVVIGDLVVVEREQGLARGQPEGSAGFADPEVRAALEPMAIDLSESERAPAGAFGDVARAREEPLRAVQEAGIRREMKGAVGVGVVADEEVDPAVGGDEDRLSGDREVADAGDRGKNGETGEKE